MRSYLLIATVLFGTMLRAQVYTVNTDDDIDNGACNSVHCSLREAINASEVDSMPSTIKFNIPGAGPHSIVPSGYFPIITQDDLSIIGESQPGGAGSILIDFGFRNFNASYFWLIVGNRFKISGIDFTNFFFADSISHVFQFGDYFNNSMNCKLSNCSFITDNRSGSFNSYWINVFRANNMKITANNFGTDHARTFISKLGACISVSQYQAIEKVAIDLNVFVNQRRAIECLSGDINITKNIFGSLDTMKALNFLNPELAIWTKDLYSGVINDNYFFGYGNRTMALQNMYGNLTVSKNRFYDNTGPGVIFLNSNSTSAVYIRNNYATLQSNNALNKSHTFIYALDNSSLAVESNEVSNYGTFLIADTPLKYGFVKHSDNKLECLWSNAVVMKAHPKPIVSSVNVNQITGMGNPNDCVVVYSNKRIGCSGAICEGGVELGRTKADTSGVWILNATYPNNSSISAFQFGIDTSTKRFGYSEFSNCNKLIIKNDDPIGSIEANKIKVFPNPTNDRIKIELNENEPVSIIIYNSNGQKLNQLFRNSKIIDLDLSNYNPGIYYIQFLGKHIQQINKIIKE